MGRKKSNAGQALGLITDFILGVRKALQERGGNEANLDNLREPALHQIIAAYLVGLPVTVGPIGTVVESDSGPALQFLDRTIHIGINPKLSTDQLIAIGGFYDNDSRDIMHRLHDVTEPCDRSVMVHLLHYNIPMSSSSVLFDMERQGLRPATFLELVWIGIQHSTLDHQVAALGSVAGVHDEQRVASLIGRKRRLQLSWMDRPWSMACRFAAVPK